MTERPCDCSERHRVFPPSVPELRMNARPRVPEPVPAMHKHEDDRCSKPFLGIGGCPGLPHCRDYILGTHNVGITLADVKGDKPRAVMLRQQRDKLVEEFARQAPLTDAAG